jgi:hypothetical protein
MTARLGSQIVISPTFISFHFLPSIFKFLGIEMVHEDKSPFSVDHVNLIFFFLEGYTEDVTIAQISVAIL